MYNNRINRQVISGFRVQSPEFMTLQKGDLCLRLNYPFLHYPCQERIRTGD